MTRRPPLPAALGALIVLAIVGSALAAVVLQPTRPGSGGAGGPSLSPGPPASEPTPAAGSRPSPGHEVYGYVPYWEMDAGIAAHLAGTDLTTVALFSVTTRRNGTLDTAQRGYQRITGPVGQRLIREAHGRGARVELVYSSFGLARNRRLFGGSIAGQDKVITGLVGLADRLRADGINVDVERLDGSLVPAYGGFVGRLRDALRAVQPAGQVSVATTANVNGAAMAMVATVAGADRIFLMGYDYHWAGSAPGASAPIERRDGDAKNLVWSLDLYEALGVPVERTILGLPFYGMAWPVVGPELGAPQTGPGDAWIPSDHLDVLRDPSLVPTLDPIEQVEVYTLPTDGQAVTGPSSGATSPSSSAEPSASAGASPTAGGWLAIYVDSPATLAPKLALADARGLAGAGFWAVGYERGLPDYAELIKRFRAGEFE